MSRPEDPTGLTIREAGARFRAGDLSPVELTTAMLERIEATEPTLHAFVTVMAEAALEAARQAERELRGGRDRGPLHGVPIAIKDIFDVQGLPTRCGSATRDEAAPAAEDAVAVARLRRAGAVIVGKTVTQEFAAGVLSPPARNPWDPTRVPGGSSGGSAAAVAAGCCLAAMGSDTGGSIRIPASLTGVVGLKPTYGLLPTGGVYPLAWSLDTVGPLASTVDDAALTFAALLSDETAAHAAMATGDAAGAGGADLRGVRLGVPRPHFFDCLQPEVAEAVEAALRRCADLGAEVIETPWPEAAAARAAAYLINRIESVAVHERTIRERPDQVAQFNPDLRLRLASGRLIPAAVYLRALRARTVVKAAVARLFADCRLDALVTPTVPATAVAAARPVIVHADGEEAVGTGYTRLTMPFNATGQPVLALPCGFDAAGMPIGLQFAGRPFGEEALCRIGRVYEQAAGWHRERPAGAMRGE